MILNDDCSRTGKRERSALRIKGLADSGLTVCKGFNLGLEPPPPVDFTKWAQDNIKFGNDSPFPGPYNPDLFPFFKDILHCLEPDHPSREIVLKKSAQLGGTIVAQVFVGGSLDLDPGPVLYVHPTIDNGSRWAKTKWKPFVSGSRALSSIFSSDRTRDTSNSTLYKERIDGRGHLLISGANSAASLSMVSFPKQVQDDLAKWENNDAGNPESQADSRSEAFEWAKIFKVSTPMVAGACRISKNYKRSDQRQFHVPCPHCDHEHPLEWENLKKSIHDDMDPADAHFTCPNCGGVIEHHHKEEMVSKGRWVAGNPSSDVPGFFIWAAYSPLTTWARIVKKWLNAKDDPESEQNFYNDTLGLAYEQKGDAPPWEEIRNRSKNSEYHAGIIPCGALVLTMGVDVQGDRVEWLLKGFGQNLQRWTIQHGVIHGHISDQRVKDSLDILMRRKWTNVFGRQLEVDMMAIDMNYETNDVIDWAKRWPENRVICVRGSNKNHAPPMTPVKRDRDRKGNVKKRQKRYWNIGVSGLKASLYAHLEKIDPFDRGYCHHPNDLDDEYYMQLCSERRILKQKKDGFTEIQWIVLPDVRNEILDMELYAESAARRLGWRSSSDDQWERLRAEREKAPPEQQLDLLEPNVLPPASPPPEHKTKGPRKKRGVRSKGL